MERNDRDAVYTNEQFGRLIAQNTPLKDVDTKWVKKTLIKQSRLLPDRGRKWSRLRIERFLFELAFVKPEDIDWNLK